jgi:hypothetical protein
MEARPGGHRTKSCGGLIRLLAQLDWDMLLEKSAILAYACFKCVLLCQPKKNDKYALPYFRKKSLFRLKINRIRLQMSVLLFLCLMWTRKDTERESWTTRAGYRHTHTGNPSVQGGRDAGNETLQYGGGGDAARNLTLGGGCSMEPFSRGQGTGTSPG